MQKPESIGYKTFAAEYHPPKEFIALLEEAGLLDRSWRNDAVPQWALFDPDQPDKEEAVACIWVEPENAAFRSEMAETRFAACKLEDDGLTDRDCLLTDDLEKAIAFALDWKK